MTGAAGNIGRHLRATLGDAFDELILLDIEKVKPTAPHERSMQVDLRDAEALRQALDGLDGVIHLGGIADEADFHDLVDVNIIGIYNLLKAARMGGVWKVVCASSNRLTGFYPTNHLVSPNNPFRPDGLYGVSKAAAETLCRLYSDKFGLQVACLRIGSFEPEPSTSRELHTWLSPHDCEQAFRAAITSAYDFTTFYAVSANAQLWWDLAPGLAVGFAPCDDAAVFANQIAGEITEPQGGVFATPEFTLSRQKPRSPTIS
jgi:uronate dehydrogenase